MNGLYKGYVETRSKKSIEKIRGRDDFKTYEQVKNLDEFAGILAEDTILVDVDEFEQSEILFKIVRDLKLQCIVYKTTRGKHFLFKNKNISGCKTHTKVACGIEVDIKVGSKNSYEVLKYAGNEREVLYDTEEYEEVPKFLYPVRTSIDFLNMKSGDGRNQSLFNYILTLQSNDFTKDEIKECLGLINKYVLKEKLDDKELDVILRDEAFKAQSFFNGQTFLFDKFATYVKNELHIKRINGSLHMFKDGIYVQGRDNIESRMIEIIPTLNRSKRSEVYDYLELLVRDNISIGDVNYIAFKNGVYSLDDGKLVDFSPNYIITNKIPWNYRDDVYSEVCDKVMDKLSCYNKEIRMLLEEMLGSCFYRSNNLGGGKSFILVGDKSNGKSTFINMINNLLGEDNICSLDLMELSEKFKNAELVNKLVNTGDDINGSFIPDTSIFKKLVTGERIQVQRKGEQPFEFNNYAKLIFSANEIPRTKDKTGAVLRRLLIIPFNATFSKDDADYDPYIKNKLRGVEVMEYLVNISIKGLIRVIDNKSYTESKKVNDELNEYNKMNNPIDEFIEDNIDYIENHTTTEVYNNYVVFCKDYGLLPMSKIEFVRQINTKMNLVSKVKRIDGKVIRIFAKNDGEN